MMKETSSGGKHTLGESESQMPKGNSRKANNLMAGQHSTASGDAALGYTDGSKIDGGSSRRDMKLRP
jgi:hypothetical protein